MEISAYSVVTIIVLLSPESGEEACASQLLVDPLLRFSSLVFAPQLHSLAALLNKLGHQSRPPGLVARPDASPIVAMKELVKIDEVPPVCIVLKFIEPAINRPMAICRTQRNSCKSARNLRSRLPQRCLPARTGRQLNHEGVPVKVMKFLKRFDQQEIDGKPY